MIRRPRTQLTIGIRVEPLCKSSLPFSSTRGGMPFHRHPFPFTFAIASTTLSRVLVKLRHDTPLAARGLTRTMDIYSTPRGQGGEHGRYGE